MKRIMICSMLMIGLAFAFLPDGSAANVTWEEIVSKEKLQKFLVGYGAEGGKSYTLGAGFAALISKYTDIQASMTAIPGMRKAGPLFNRGEVDFTSLSASQPLSAYRGKGQDKVRLRVIANGGGLAKSYAAFRTTPKKGIKSIKDLKGKKIAYLPAVPWEEPMIEGALRANNLAMKDVTLVASTSDTIMMDWLNEGRVDASVGVMGMATLKLSKQAGLHLIALTSKEQEEIAKLTHYQGDIIPKGFLGAPTDTPSLGAPLCWWFRAGINNITAYTVTKTFWTHVEEWHKVHKSATGYVPENNLKAWYLPWHPGAIKYYQEIGTWKDTHTQKQRELISKEKEVFGDVPDIKPLKALGILD